MVERKERNGQKLASAFAISAGFFSTLFPRQIIDREAGNGGLGRYLEMKLPNLTVYECKVHA